MNFKKLNRQLKSLLESKEQYYVMIHISDVDWLVEEEDFDHDVTKEEIEEFKKTIPSDFNVELDLDEDEVEVIHDLMKQKDKSFPEALREYLQTEDDERLSDLVSDETGWLHNGFSWEVVL